MSAEGVVSSTRSTGANVRLIAALLVGVALGAAAALLVTARATDASRRREIARAVSPDKSRVAVALEAPCTAGLCQELRIGASADSTGYIASLTNESCDEIVWTPDGKRVGFVIQRYELWLYDPQTLALVGKVRLLTSEAAQSRIARGITFSENGRAVTFDDCPRTHSGCRAGLVGIPQ